MELLLGFIGGIAVTLLVIAVLKSSSESGVTLFMEENLTEEQFRAVENLRERLCISDIQLLSEGLSILDILTETEAEGAEVKVHHVDGEVEQYNVTNSILKN